MSKTPAKATAVSLVVEIRAGLPTSHEWTERDRALLDLAARQAADIDRLEADIADQGVRVQGRGASVLNQSICEVRQGRVALARILGQVDVPDAPTTRSLHARKAAVARWQPQQEAEAG
jgi:hypothetical protein